MKVYKINKEKLGMYMVKQGLGAVLSMVYSLLIFVLLILVVGFFKGGKMPDIDVWLKILTSVFPWIIGLFSFVFIMSFFKIWTYEARRHAFTLDSVHEIQIDSEVDVVNKYFQNKMERKTGQSKEQHILFSEIKTIAFRKKGVIIKSENFNIMNGNGKIIIPCETEDYQNVISLVRQLGENHHKIEVTDKVT